MQHGVHVALRMKSWSEGGAPCLDRVAAIGFDGADVSLLGLDGADAAALGARAKALVGEHVTTQEMAGLSISICRSEADVRLLWSAPARVPFFHRPEELT